MANNKLILVYRDNDLFAEVAPSLQARLTEEGIDTNIVSVPRKTFREEIPSVLEPLKDQFRGTIYFADNTTGNWLYDHRDSLECIGSGYTLDGVVESGLAKSIFGKEFANRHGYISRSEDEFVDMMNILVRKMLGTGTPVPEVVGISDTAILDHDPFRKGLDPTVYTPENITAAYNTVRKALVQGGIPEERIERVSAKPIEGMMLRDISPFLYWDIPNKTHGSPCTAWSIHDRHARHLPHGYGEVDPIVRVFSFELPLGNFYKSAVKNGLVHADNKAVTYMVERVKEIIAELD